MFVKYLMLFTLLLISYHGITGEPGKCREGVSKDLTAHQLLRQDVFCSYDKEVRPVIKHTINTTVSLKMFIMFFKLDEATNLLEVHTWVALSWNDAHLKWTPSDYGNITSLHVQNREIWQPDLAIYNSGDMDSKMGWRRTVCVVYPTGTVMCVPTAKWPVHCTANLKHWPFDTHECIMRIGSWSHTGEMLNIILQDGGVGMDDFQPSREWDLQNVTAVKHVAEYDCCPNATYQSAAYKFIIKRHASAYAATVVIPSLILAVMTLSTFWMDPKPPHRMALCSISVLCHCLYLQYLGTKLPSNGTVTPVIVLFFRDSLIITGAALVIAVILLRLASPSVHPVTGNESPPMWISKLLNIVLDQRVGQILLLGEFDSKNPVSKGDAANLIEDGKELNAANSVVNSEWLILVTGIDHLAFLVLFLTYVVLLIALIPV